MTATDREWQISARLAFIEHMLCYTADNPALRDEARLLRAELNPPSRCDGCDALEPSVWRDGLWYCAACERDFEDGTDVA